METENVKDPKNEKILNKDDSVINSSDTNDTVEKGTDSANEAEKELVPLTDSDNSPQLSDESASNKGQGPAGENL